MTSDATAMMAMALQIKEAVGRIQQNEARNVRIGIFPDMHEIGRRLVGEHVKHLPGEVADVQVVGVRHLSAHVTEECSESLEVLRV